MKLIDCIHVCLIIFLIYYFNIIDLLKSDKDSSYFDSIMNPTLYESMSVTWANDSGPRALDFVWMSYRGAHMLTDSLPEGSHPKSSHIVRLSNK